MNNPAVDREPLPPVHLRVGGERMSRIGGVTVTARLDREKGSMSLRVVVVRADTADQQEIFVRECVRSRNTYSDATVFYAELSFGGKMESPGNTVVFAATYEKCPEYKTVVIVYEGAVIALKSVEWI